MVSRDRQSNIQRIYASKLLIYLLIVHGQRGTHPQRTHITGLRLKIDSEITLQSPRRWTRHGGRGVGVFVRLLGNSELDSPSGCAWLAKERHPSRRSLLAA
jgi:hypothetical protein